MNKKILVTGGAGFIGSHLVNYLIKKKYHVVVIDNLSGGFRRNVNKEAIFIRGTITNYQTLERIFQKHHFDYVFHLAAYAAEGLSHFVRRFNYQNNLIGSVNLINLSVKHKIKRFVFTSSIAVYGSGCLPMNETQTPLPEDPYGIAKYAIELDLKSSSRLFDLKYTIYRPHNIYGPNQNINDPYRNVIGIFLKAIVEKQFLPIFGDGTQKRAFTYIDDIVAPLSNSINLASTINQTINIGTDKIVSVNELAQLVSKITNSNCKIKYLKKRKEVDNAYCSHKKFVDIFKTNKNTPLDVGLLKTFEWVKKNYKNLKQSKLPNIEIDQNLPEIWQK